MDLVAKLSPDSSRDQDASYRRRGSTRVDPMTTAHIAVPAPGHEALDEEHS